MVIINSFVSLMILYIMQFSYRSFLVILIYPKLQFNQYIEF